MVGTRNSEVIEIGEKSGGCATIVFGHGEGELWGLCCHPTSNMCCTTSLDKTARLWDLNEKVKMILFLLLPALSGGFDARDVSALLCLWLIAVLKVERHCASTVN